MIVGSRKWISRTALTRATSAFALAGAFATLALQGIGAEQAMPEPSAPQHQLASPATDVLLHGFTEPAESIEVAAAETGTLEQVTVELGTAVRKGDVLATLDSQVLAATLRLAKVKAASTADRDAAEIEVSRLQRRLDSLRALMAKGHARASELDAAESQLAVAKTKLKQAEEQHLIDQLEEQRIDAQIERRKVRSPIDGLVTQIHKKLGEFVASTEPQIATVVRLDQLRTKFFVSTEHASKITVGDRMTVALGHPETNALATVEYVAPITDSQSGTVHIELIVDNDSGEHRAGIPCRLLLMPELASRGHAGRNRRVNR